MLKGAPVFDADPVVCGGAIVLPVRAIGWLEVDTCCCEFGAPAGDDVFNFSG